VTYVAKTPGVHSFVVVSATREGVEVLDPQQGPRGLDIDEFLESWSPMNDLAIVIA
jgi:ABC-type bacteriocin/lantibiotic exporter with double-glycine peptidase domain